MQSLRAPASEAAGYFAAVSDAYANAVAAVGGNESYRLAISDVSISLEFAGPALPSLLLPALSHLQREADDPRGLTVRVWDSGSTGVELPVSPWSEGSYEARGALYEYLEGRVLYRDGRFRMYFYQASDVIMLDYERREAVCWFRDARTVPYYESGAPFRALLQWWLEEQGLIVVHAAAVGIEAGGVMLAGKGGSGKSTTALLCLDSKLLYAADDYCLLGFDPEPCVHCLYNTGKVGADNLSRLPHLHRFVRNREKLDVEKAIVFLNDHVPDKLIHSFPVKALLLPEITGSSHSSIVPASAAAGLMALAPSTIFQQAGPGDGSFGHMARLSRSVPTYRLLLGSDTRPIPELVYEFIQDNTR